jgi:dihydroceramidase
MSEGLWLPHTSSVDFCEPDYALTSTLAEPFNAFSSLIIAWFGLIGLIYCNPTKEWPFTGLFMIVLFIGLGSFGLHATLHWLPQSFDEIPMLWYDTACLYTLVKLKSESKISVDYVLAAFLALTVLVTSFYYSKRSFYIYFLTIYSVATGIVIIWDSYLVWAKPRDPLIIKVWSCAIFVYLCVASVIWVIDMHLCDVLLPYYMLAHGMTFHIIWHITAGLGAHLLILNFVLLRARVRKVHVHIEWVWAVPVVRETITSKKSK